MAVGYRWGYRLDITPWQHRGAGGDDAFQLLLDREENERTRPLGRALDLGCGTGAHTRVLNERGWDVMGIDNIRKAVDQAITRGGEQSRYVLGDVSYLEGSGVGKNFSFYLDVGCFHGLNEAARPRMGQGVTALAAPDATLLMFALSPHHNPFLPRGATPDDVAKAFPDWRLLDVRDADASSLPASLRGHDPHWIRLGLS